MTELELDRYSRQLLLSNFDVQGQVNLAQARILIVGMGGLGNIAATYLASAGVGQLLLIDDDQVEVSNLPRQVLYDEAQLGMSKVQAAQQQLLKKNPHCEVLIREQRLTYDDIDELVDKATLVLDCTDNFTTRQMINRACYQQKTALVSAAAIRWEGQLISFRYDQTLTTCYECLYPDLSDQQLSCNQSGVIGPVVGTLGVLQALDALKIASQCGEVKHAILRLFDGFTGQWRQLGISAEPNCSVCSHKA
ncbi:HesA/MoeB/ThiF family protein [Marinomonas epiphytica]